VNDIFSIASNITSALYNALPNTDPHPQHPNDRTVYSSYSDCPIISSTCVTMGYCLPFLFLLLFIHINPMGLNIEYIFVSKSIQMEKLFLAQSQN
jgi:hypothetical protein